MLIADQLMASFGRIAAADGGQLEVLAEDDACVRMGYRSGVEADCADGVCALPQAEIEAMMRAWLARKAPDKKLEVELLTG
jgi:hypothetical protein